MNKIICLLLMFIALNVVITRSHAGQAIQISLLDSDAETLQQSDLQAIKSVIGQAVSQGDLASFIVYNHELKQSNQFFACAKAAKKTSESGEFFTFVSQLQAIQPISGQYTLQYTANCNKDNTLVCLEDRQCFPNAFITSPAYSMYMARKQFGGGLKSIEAAKALLDKKFQQKVISIHSPSDIGLANSSDNCASIAINNYDIESGTVSISCMLRGNYIIDGKEIILWRFIDTANNKAVWQCTSGMIDSRYKANKCF